MTHRDGSHHWRVVDRDIPSQVASPQSLGPIFPVCAMHRLPSKIAKIIWTQEPMPKKIPVLNLLPPTLGQQYVDGID